MAGNHPHWSDPPDDVRVVTHRYRDGSETLIEETVRYHIYRVSPTTIITYKTPGYLERRIVPESELIVDMTAQPPQQLVEVG